MEDKAPTEKQNTEGRQAHQTQEELEELIAQHTRELEMTNIWLQASEERYRTLFEDSLQGIMVIIGKPYHVALSNSAANSILGYTSDELARLSSDEFMAMIHWTDRNRFLGNLDDLLTGNKKFLRMDVRFNKLDESVIWLDLSMTKMLREDEISILITFIDITEQRMIMADLTNSKRDLEIYASLLRHDLRNDLLVISGNMEIIRMLTSESETVQEYIEANLAGVTRMLEVLKVFGTPSEQEAKQIAPILESVWADAMKSYVGMQCKLHIDPEVFMTRVVGGRLLPMVFNNLLRNSAKYGGKTPVVNITASRTGEFIQIVVADDGPGVSPVVREKLFEKGVSTKGSGLGLYLSKKVVEAYGGTIELVEPRTKEEGAVFVVKLAISSE
jgi:PAS domain S-box-containing protein